MRPNRKKIKTNELGLYDQLWERRFLELTKFKKKYGHCDVPSSLKKKKYFILATWCNTQRAVRKLNRWKYPPYRVKRLTELGFSWSLYDKRFESNFGQLKVYRQKYGHCNVSNTENPKLAQWCRHIRTVYKKEKSVLSKDRMQRLMKLGFVMQSRLELNWEQQFARLKKYKKKYGNYNVSQSLKNIHYRNLATWINRQRINYQEKAKGLTDERISRLNGIGFSWKNPVKRGDAIRISDNALLNELKRLYSVSEIVPTSKYVDKYGKYTANTYTNHFGSIVKARKAAGINLPVIVIKQKKYSDVDLLNELKRLANLLGRTPTAKDMIKHGKYTVGTYYQRFDSIIKARKAAGINLPVIMIKPKKYSDVELLNELKRLANLLGRTPTASDVIKYGKYSEVTYYQRFGSIIKARKAAGIETPVVYPKRISDAESLGELKRLTVLLGKRPKTGDVIKHAKYSPNLYRKRFGSLSQACIAAGIVSVVSK